MSVAHPFFKALGIKSYDLAAIKQLASETGISVERLKYYDKNKILPSDTDVDKICSVINIHPLKLKLLMGCLDRKTIAAIQNKAEEIYEIIKSDSQSSPTSTTTPRLMLTTDYGHLYQGDCLDLMRDMEAESVDLVFADPPFNLNKKYPSKIDDSLKSSDYLDWCELWLNECIRILKPAGSLFLWNLPKWNSYLSEFLNNRLTFRHWISVDIKYRFPIAGRLYPSHYSLLYYCKGEKPKTFHPDRLPLEICSNCYQELHDYGGYKHKMNPKGVNLTDVWYDIPPVRHKRYKQREGANELSIKLMDRIIEMASNQGDLIFDPFGGAGTTYVVAEMKRRHWLGIEIGPVDDILRRFQTLDQERDYLKQIQENYNCLFTDKTLKVRTEKGIWTSESVNKKADNCENTRIKHQNKTLAIQTELDLFRHQ
ncbi:DNA methyltransferase [Coleofasciculus sp.]|uniref:DNA methyltransferase n=1 Tax=Coleofasciculus sp. TaxID=3100458 RepID=UPI0039F9BED5